MAGTAGGVVATGMDDREMIELGGDSGDWERDRRTVSRAELIGIMRPRVEEILDFVVNPGIDPPVYVRDVADVSLGLKERSTISRPRSRPPRNPSEESNS